MTMLPAMNELDVMVVDGERSLRLLLSRALSADLGVSVRTRGRVRAPVLAAAPA